MFKAIKHRYLVDYDGKFSVARSRTTPPKGAPSGKDRKKGLERHVEALSDLQRVLYADDRHSLLLVFQAMDAAGKDSTIRAVLSGVNPAGCQVFAFKQPSHRELDHDFLWRTAQRMPERGRIGVFNRSYYEEVLVVRVHPEYLGGQKLPYPIRPKKIWQERYESIREHELHLARNGVVILKFWLNVSKDEQRERFLSRIEEPEKNWKFSSSDVKERGHWKAYMRAYQEVLRETSRPWAPWFAIPADDKPYMRMCVADIVVQTLESLDISYPKLGDAERARLEEMRQQLENED